MFGHNYTYDHSSEFLIHCPLADTITLTPSPLLPGDATKLGYAGGSIMNYVQRSPTLIQRSISSHSLLKNSDVQTITSSVRKASSTGDLLGVNIENRNLGSNSPLSNDQNGVMESMNRACKYSPEEKKERIERYRSKRNLRNFNKKIKYECRKTLADSRPRIRGRFARNDETEKTPQRWHNIFVEEDDESDDSWINFLDAFQQNLIP
ncbi:CCT motif family protein [Dorcoceras hygrometricum]|uniref:CCT motif family protein n=1 Tax=Dorcoceras hygrometricum TaxID=472368 RepID=A0A2Z7AR95_9LAMI|nr:CCT motif family protein [Dorcoceras hygrometricum]